MTIVRNENGSGQFEVVPQHRLVLHAVDEILKREEIRSFASKYIFNATYTLCLELHYE